MVDRQSITVQAAPGGWPEPWPGVAEIEAVLPHENWTLIGGLMTQLYAIHYGIDAVRPTNDIDIVLHVETEGGTERPAKVARALESLGYSLKPSIDPRNNTAHRFTRGKLVDGVVTTDVEIVDVVIADHAAPRVLNDVSLRGRDMVQVDGGTQALRRTLNAHLTITESRVTTVSVPRPVAALILKAAAYNVDSRNPDRHLTDAAVLLACVEDPFEEVEHFGGHDRPRLRKVQRALADPNHRAWQQLPGRDRRNARDALDILCE